MNVVNKQNSRNSNNTNTNLNSKNILELSSKNNTLLYQIEGLFKKGTTNNKLKLASYDFNSNKNPISNGNSNKVSKEFNLYSTITTTKKASAKKVIKANLK